MPAPVPMIGYGLTLMLDPTGGTSFSAIAGIVDSIEAGFTVEAVDTELFDDAWKTSVPAGAIDPGEVSYQIALDPSSDIHADLFEMMTTRAIGNCKLVFPDGSNYWTSEVWVKELSETYNKDEMIVCDVVFQRTGEVVYGNGSGA